jgi:hypothetical protein
MFFRLRKQFTDWDSIFCRLPDSSPRVRNENRTHELGGERRLLADDCVTQAPGESNSVVLIWCFQFSFSSVLV